MNKRLFTHIVFLVSLCLMVGQSYACPTLTAIISDPDPKFFGKEMAAGFYGGSSIGSISLCTWSGPLEAGPYDVEFDTWHYLNDEIKCKFHNPGAYLITLIVTDEENPNRTDDANCVFYVMEADLDINDVPDDDEENPGGYVSFNNDDDNDNGTPDKDEETVTVDGEDNLVEIYLSVTPSLSTGVMRLELEKFSRTNVRVWSSPTKGEGNMIIPNGDPADPCYYKEWDLSQESMLATLYVEGISPSYPRMVTLWLSYKKDNACIHQDIVKFTVVELKLFRDSWYSKVLDDWPKDGDQLRSPKYIFGKNDPIYVKVMNLGTDPYTAETFFNFVKVTSDSDGLIYLDLKETGTNTQTFMNSEAEGGELLYLSTINCEGNDRDQIKVLDEQVLTFWLQIQPDSGNYVTCKTVMVDRAEVAAVDGTPTLDAAEFHGDMVSHDFFSVEPVGLYDLSSGNKSQGDDDKCVELGNKADIMYVAGHCTSGDNPTRIFGADSTYGLDNRGHDDNLKPSDVVTWDEELEWLVLACCSTMNIDPVTKTGLGIQWVATMDGTGRGHAIMGYRNGAPGGTTQTTDIEIANDFVYEVTFGIRNVTASWMSPNFDHQDADEQGGHFYSPLHAVAIGRYDNSLDCIDSSVALDNFVSRDSTDNWWSYTWISWVYDAQSPGNVSNNPPPEFRFFDYP